MANEIRDDVSPTREEAGAITAPTLSAAEEIAELQAEVARLKNLLAGQDASPTAPADWPGQINYAASHPRGVNGSAGARDQGRASPVTATPSASE